MTDSREQANRREIAHGEPEDARAPVRDVTKDEQDQSATLHALQASIQEGLDGGVSDRTLRKIWAEAEQRYRARHGLT